MDCSAMPTLDTYAMETLSKLRKELKSDFNCALLFSEMDGNHHYCFIKHNLLDEHQQQLTKMDTKFDSGSFFFSVDQAISSLNSKQKEEGTGETERLFV
jgi:hypothetical protein